jgi:lysozyme
VSAVTDIATPRLKTEEGYKAMPYKDSKGLLTVGYGLNLTVPQPEAVWAAALAAKVGIVEQELQRYDWYQKLDTVRQSVLLDMAYNMGIGGLLHFPHMLAAIAKSDWQTAHDEMLDSQYAKDVGNRAVVLSQMLLTGVNNV